MHQWLLRYHAHHLGRMSTSACKINEVAYHWAPWSGPCCLVNYNTNILSESFILNYFFSNDNYYLKLEICIFNDQHSIKCMLPGTCQWIVYMWYKYKTYRRMCFLGFLDYFFILNKNVHIQKYCSITLSCSAFYKGKIPKITSRNILTYSI